MALGSTQPLTEMSTGEFPGDKGGRCVRLTTYYHPVPLSWNLGTLISWNPLGLSPAMGLFYLYSWSNRTLTSGKFHFSANMAEVIRIIYALSGYNTNYDSQRKLPRHNFHERTWGHHLQYPRSRTTLNKHCRELTANWSRDENLQRR